MKPSQMRSNSTHYTILSARPVLAKRSYFRHFGTFFSGRSNYCCSLKATAKSTAWYKAFRKMWTSTKLS